MAKLILGIILLAVPFVMGFVYPVRNKVSNGVYVLFFLFLFHAVLAFFTQFFGIFYYKVILGANLLAVFLMVLVWFFRYRKRQFCLPKIDWVIFAVVAISILTLYQIHYNYTGKINLATDQTPSYHEAKSMKYIYPYFADEWYAVSFIKYSIDSHALPLRNVLENSFFLNLEMFFHSFTAEIILFLGLDPLTQYSVISILFNVLIIVLAYVFLRINNVSKLASGICSLSILYIASGANLPGIWNFIPVHLGIIFSLIGFCFMTQDNFFMAALAAFAVIFFYGPLFVFYGLGLAVFSLLKFFRTKRKIFMAASYFLICLFFAVPAVYVILLVSPLAGAAKYIASKLFYVSFTGFNIPQFAFYNVIPIWIILLLIPGLFFAFKTRKWIFFPFLLGVIYWIFYSFSIYRIVIEYERAVFFASITAVLISGFGFEYLEKYYSGRKFKVLKCAEALAMISFLLFIPFYTSQGRWEKLILIDKKSGAVSFPKSPANNYLTRDDLKIFENIKEKRFLSVPWKGTVIGIATENHPAMTKEGTISMGQEALAGNFMTADCKTKKQIAEDLNIDYVYFYEFECSGFKEKARSGENFVLYQFEK